MFLLLSRCIGSHRYLRLHILRVCRYDPVAYVYGENGLRLAQILCLQTEFVYQRFPWRPIHLCTVLDVYLWYGSRVLGLVLVNSRAVPQK